jgi:YbbR domain-containing protein
VDVPQQEYNDVVYSNYNPRVDLSRITEAGEQTVKVSTTSTTLYGTVTDVSPEEIPIVIDNYITNYRIPVQVSVIGEYPDGFFGTTPTTDVSTVTVSGPESIVSTIAKIVLEYDVSGLAARAATLQTALTLHYMDIDNNELDDTLLEPTSGGVLLRSIVLEQKLYPIKTFSLNQTALTTGAPKTGYEVKSVTLSPSVIVAAGDETALSTLDTLFLEEAVDVTGRDAPFSADIRVAQPDNIVYMSTKTVSLAVDIGSIQKTQTFENIPISVTGIPDGMIAAAQTTKVSVTLTGPMLSLETMEAAKIKASVSAEGLSAGTFDLPVEITVNHSDADLFTYDVLPQTVSVAVAGK